MSNLGQFIGLLCVVAIYTMAVCLVTAEIVKTLVAELP